MSDNNDRIVDDELELERTIDEEVYEIDETEEVVEDEETLLEEEKADEYYEDMLDEQWEEIQALEAEKKAKAKERLEKKKAKKRLERKRKQREQEAKDAQKLSSHIHKEGEMPKPTDSIWTGQGTFQSEVPIVPVTEETARTEDRRPTESYVEPEYISGDTREPEYRRTETQYSEQVYKEQTYKQPESVPITPNYEEPKTPHPSVENNQFYESSSANRQDNYAGYHDDYEERHRDDYRSEDYFKHLEAERKAEAVRREQENKTIPAPKPTEEIKYEERVVDKASTTERTVSPTYIPLDTEDKTVPRGSNTGYQAQEQPSRQEVVREEMYESDYSRDHKREMAFREEKRAEYQQNVEIKENKKEEYKTPLSGEPHKEVYKGQNREQNMSGVHVPGGDISSHEYHTPGVPSHQASHSETFASSGTPTKNNNVDDSLYIGANNKVIDLHEKSFYADNGIPVSIMRQAEEDSRYSVSHRKQIAEMAKQQDIGDKVEIKEYKTTGSAKSEIRTTSVSGSKNEVAIKSEDGIKEPAATFRIRGNSALQGHINNSSYVTAAVAVAKKYDDELDSLNADISITKDKINALKAKDSVRHAAEIKTLENMIAVRTDKIKVINADKERVVDFIAYGAHPFTKVSKVELLKSSDYSRSHMMDIRTGKVLSEEAAEKVTLDKEKSKGVLKSNDNLKLVQKNRLDNLLGKAGARLKDGAKNAFKKAVREDEDIDKGMEVYEESSSVVQIIGRYSAHAQLKKELNKYGLSPSAINKKIKEMGVIVGVGDVSKMSIEKLEKLLNDSNLAIDAKKKIAEVIDLKTKLRMGPEKIAEELLKDAGEYLGYSSASLKKMLKADDLGFVQRGQIEKALEYKKLSKLQLKASGRWKAVKGFSGNLVQKALRNNDYISDAIDLSSNAKTGYKIARSAANMVKTTTKPATDFAKQKAAQAISGLKQKAGISGVAKKTVGTEFAKQNASSGIGSRIKNLIGGSKASASAATAKGVNRFAQAFAKVKGAVVSVGKAIAGFVGSGVSAAGVAVAAVVALLIIIVIMLFTLIIISVYTIVLGDESTNTDVVQLVEYLDEKNQEMLRQIDERVNGVPLTKDKKNTNMSGYTEVMYTYLDPNGNVCLVTNNTRELIAMAAVYFEQDLSDERAVKAFLDEMWEKSHEVTFTESGLYGCNGTVCLDESHNFNPSAKGYNGNLRYYNCGEDYATDIKYLDCFPIQPERNLRISTDKLSYRFSNSVRYDSDYSGISDLRTEDSTAGYGCVTKTSTWYCDRIEGYDSQLQKRLVDKTGKSYSTLVHDGGCELEHPYVRQGKPATGCDDYDIVDHIEEDGEDVYFYLCDEYDCDGHSITYYHCDMSHAEKVCDGHVDLSVNVSVLSFDELFDITVDDPREGFEGWNEDNVDWTMNIYEQDWEDFYGVTIPSSLFINEDGIVSSIVPTHPNSLPIPLYNQLDYPNSPYGTSTVASSGCGVTCVAMVTTYYKGQEYSPAAIGRLYGQYYVTGVGSSWGLFPGSAADLGIPYEKQTSSWADVVAALQDGKPVICSQSTGIFTSEGHFILLTGITEDGRILVNDPNGANYNKNQVLKDGFANGFSQEQIQTAARSYWIYGKKE